MQQQFTIAGSANQTKAINQANIVEMDFLAKNKETIIFIEASSQYCNIHKYNQSSPELLRIAINSIEDFFTAKDFIRIHRSYIINIKFIKEFIKSGRDYKVIIEINKIKKELPIARSYLKNIKELIKQKKIAS